MTEGLEGVLQQLQSVLVQLNTVLENQDRPVKDVENDAENDTGQKTSVEGSLQQLHRWLQGRIPTPNRLREIRNGLINLLQKGALHEDALDEDAPRPAELSGGTIYFRGHHHLGVTLQLRTRAFDIRTLVNMSDTNKQPFLKEIEENWPDNFKGWKFPTCGSPRIHSSDDWLVGKLYDSDPLGYPSNYECEDDSQSDLAPGRVYIVHISQGCEEVIDFPKFAFLCNWLQAIERPAERSRGFIQCDFVWKFVKPWVPRLYGTDFIFQGKQLQMECHFHHCEPYNDRTYLSKVGILAHRQQASIRQPTHSGEDFITGGGAMTDFYESRSSLCLTLVQISGTLAYTLLVLVDDTINFIPPPNKGTWQKTGITPCGKAVGISQFQAMIVVLVDRWEKRWELALDAIDGTIRVKLDDIRDDERWNGLMFDNSFELSKLYFTVLQLLRIVTEWVEESVNDLNDLRERYGARKRFLIEILNMDPDDLASTEKNWDTVITIMDSRAKGLLDRINKKTEEVKSLRDGLFNATSLREASKGIALNRSIYVFTVVTVIYTPLAFVSALWALPIFNNNPNNNGGPPLVAFVSTFVLIPLLTYAISLFAVGYFSLESSKRSFNSENSQRLIGAGFKLMRATREAVISFVSSVTNRMQETLERVRWVLLRDPVVIPESDLPLSSTG